MEVVNRVKKPSKKKPSQGHFYDAQMAGLVFVESILTQMKKAGVSKRDLAARLGKAVSYVDGVFKSGKLSFQTACEFAAALELHFMPTLCKDTKTGLERTRGLLDDCLLVGDDGEICFPVVMREPDDA